MSNIIYIPKDLDDAINTLIDELPKNDLKEVRYLDIAELHHTLGRSIRNRWELWQKSHLAKWFEDTYGLTHADDMSSIIIICLQRTLNKEELKIEELVEECKA